MKKAAEADALDRTFSGTTLQRKGIRGKYFARVTKGTNLVRLSPEVARLFPTDDAVNYALLSLAELSRSLPNLTARPKQTARKRAAA